MLWWAEELLPRPPLGLSGRSLSEVEILFVVKIDLAVLRRFQESDESIIDPPASPPLRHIVFSPPPQFSSSRGLISSSSESNSILQGSICYTLAVPRESSSIGRA